MDRGTQIAWLTDIHLNFVPPWDVTRLLHVLSLGQPAAVVITGDIGEALDVGHYLRVIHDGLTCPIYFVLGNHDFYHGSISGVRAAVRALAANCPRLHYLTGLPCQSLGPHLGLVGHDGWADGRWGSYAESIVEMMDQRWIAELQGRSKQDRWEILQQLAGEGARDIRTALQASVHQYRHLWLATHVPPFREACWHAGRISDDQWAPHFTCKAIGDVVLDVMATAPDCQLTILCGHSHGQGDVWMRSNVRVLTGAAEYGHPDVARWLALPGI